MHSPRRHATLAPTSAIPAALAPTLVIIIALAASMFVTHAEVVIVIGSVVALATFYLLRRTLLRQSTDADLADQCRRVASHAVDTPEHGSLLNRPRARVARPVQERGR
jgi:hypothetical protein